MGSLFSPTRRTVNIFGVFWGECQEKEKKVERVVKWSIWTWNLDKRVLIVEAAAEMMIGRDWGVTKKLTNF